MNKTTKHAILDVLKKNRLASLFLLITIICVILFSLLPPQILRFLIDEYLVGKQTAQNSTDGLIIIAALYFASFVIVGIFDVLKGFLLTVFGQKIIRSLRSLMAEKLTHIKAPYFSNHASGTITSHFLNDVENINSLFSNGIISLLIDCFKIVGIVISIWIFSVRLGIFVLCLLPFLYWLTVSFRKRMLLSQSANLKELGKVNNHIAESMKNRMMIKSFHKERYMEERYDEFLLENYATMNKVNFYDSCYSPIIQIITALATAVILLMASGGDAVLGISIGMLTATISLITSLFAPIDNLGTELQSIQKGMSGIRSVDDFLAQTEDDSMELDIDIKQLRDTGMDFCFSDMSFSYDADTPVLENMNLHLLPRENVSFIGRTGVGKTTMFKLITGLLRPTKGSITLGGIDVYRISNSQKRQIFGYVEQHFSFVRGTIAEQISLWDDHIEPSQIEAAMKFTGLHEYILTLEHGYQTDVGDGSLFSQGQKQLLGIARAIVTDPPILLLDEVTANLDSMTEGNVVSVLKKAGEHKMILSITHRMSSLLDSDRVITLVSADKCAHAPGAL
ncbi:MAG: ABC transporter ATP-binding protein [Clostridium sp.]